jgi:two-component system, LytTR family, response regulator
MRVLIVDDEALARTALVNILAERSDVEVADTAEDAVEALGKLECRSYDVLLLDINMPELSGLELVDRLQRRESDVPSVVFVTAHDEHAIQAFEKKAVDYVLKPFSSERIGEALDVAFRRTAGERAARLVEVLSQLRAHVPWHAAERIAVKTKGRVLFVDPANVIAVEAERNCVLLQQTSGSCLLRESISAMEEKLAPYGFVRIHRSVLINSAFVHEIQPWPTGEYVLRVKGPVDHKEYTVTRTYKKNLKLLAKSWIGTENFGTG